MAGMVGSSWVGAPEASRWSVHPIVDPSIGAMVARTADLYVCTVTDLFDSLDVRWDRGGILIGTTSSAWGCFPAAVIGQIRGGATRSDEDGGASTRYRDGDAYVMPAGVRHRFVQQTRGDCTYRWSHTALRVFGTVDLRTLVAIPRRLPDGDAIGDAVAGMARAAEIADPLARAAQRKRLGFGLLALLLAHGQPTPRAAAFAIAADRLRPALERMERDLAQPLGRTALAREVGLSPTRFHTVFARALGCAPMAYLQRLRLARAQDLLIGTDQPIGAIAALVGIPDPFHFSRLFRRRIGESPRAYRVARRSQLPPS